MKTATLVLALVMALSLVSCVKEDPIEPVFSFDCYKSSITYTENEEFIHQENYYYSNNLIVRLDCSPNYIWNWKYDSRNNLIKFESSEGSGYWWLYSYDSYDRCIFSEFFIADTLYSRTEKQYSDTLVIKEIYFDYVGVISNTIDYYYNFDNLPDSILSNTQSVYHKYPGNQHIVTRKDKNGVKTSEEITTTENGNVIKFEEYIYRDSELIRSLIDSKEYDDEGRLAKLVLEQFSEHMQSILYPYQERRYSYDSKGNILKTDNYDAEGILLEYVEYYYDSGNLVKKQSFDNDGNKTGYTIVENTCN